MWIPLFSSFCLFLQDTDLINHSASHSLHGYNFSCLHFCILKPLHLSLLSLSVGPSMLNPHRLSAFSFIHLFSWALLPLESLLSLTSFVKLLLTSHYPCSLCVAHSLPLHTSLCVPQHRNPRARLVTAVKLGPTQSHSLPDIPPSLCWSGLAAEAPLMRFRTWWPWLGWGHNSFHSFLLNP